MAYSRRQGNAGSPQGLAKSRMPLFAEVTLWFQYSRKGGRRDSENLTCNDAFLRCSLLPIPNEAFLIYNKSCTKQKSEIHGISDSCFPFQPVKNAKINKN